MFRRRLNVVYYVICAGLLMVGARLFHLQALQPTLEDPSQVLFPPKPFKEVPARRGTIRDRHGKLLAEDIPTRGLAIQYEHLLEPEAWMPAVRQVTGKSEEEVLKARDTIVRRVKRIRAAVPRRIRKIREETIPHVLLADISDATIARVESDRKRFKGITVTESLRRYYPQGAVAAHVIGYLGRAQRLAPNKKPKDLTIRPGDKIGLTGVEKQFDRLLRGVPGVVREETGRFPRGSVKSGSRKRFFLFPAEQGHTVFLTLDLAAQQCAEQSLEGKAGAVVVMDARNGELLVLASSPLFDPNDVQAALRTAAQDSSFRPMLSRAIQDSVPSGSVIKPIVALAAASVGVAGPETTSDCTGSIIVGRRTFHCVPRGHGRADMVRAIEVSCNTYFYRLGMKAKPEAILKMARALGWGKKTGVNLPFEWPGRLPSVERRWYAGDTCILSIGQGNLQVTPIQVAVAMAAIANGGKVLRPTILLKITPEPDPLLERRDPVVRELDLPRAALRAVRAGMRKVAETGTARHIRRLKALGVAVKTGTAETADSSVNHAWIAGFVPHDDPRYAFAVVVHRTSGHGADVAGPIAADVLETLLRERAAEGTGR